MKTIVLMTINNRSILYVKGLSALKGQKIKI